MSLKEWRQKQILELTTPSGLKVKVKVPDYLLLIQDWRDCGVKMNDPKTDLGKAISEPTVVAHLLLKYVLQPKITVKRTSKSIGVKELIEKHPTDAQIIYAEIVKPYITQSSEVMQFFRKYGAWAKAGLSGVADRVSAKPADAEPDPNESIRKLSV